MAEGLATAEITELTNKLVALNEALSPRNLEIFKLVAKNAFNIKQQDLDESLLFTSVYNVLEKKFPRDTVLNIVIGILIELDVQRPLVDALQTHARPENEVWIMKDQKQVMDFILTVSNILCGLQERQYLTLRDMARCIFLTNFDTANITSRTHLFQLLLDHNYLTHEKFHYLFAWLEVIGCRAKHKELRRYCRHHNITEPEWKNLVPSLKEKFPLADEPFLETHPQSSPKSCPVTYSLPSPSDTALRDGAVPRSVDDPYSKQVTHFDSTYSSSPTVSYRNPVPPVGASGTTSLVTTSAPSMPNDSGVLVDGKMRGTKHESRPQDSDESDEGKDIGSSTTELSCSQMETQSVEEEDQKSLVKKEFHMKPATTSRLDNVAASNDATPSINTTREDFQPVSKEPRWPKIRDWLCRCKYLIILVALLISVLLCIGGASGGLTYYFIGPNPDSKNVTLAENATVLVGCYNPLHIGSITISATARTVIGFYYISQSLLIAEPTHLPTTTYKRSGAGQYINFNYYNFAPLYTAGPGTIAYSLNFTNLPPSGSKNACFYSYLYHSYDAYDQTLNGSPSSDYDDFYMVCPNATGVVYPFDLSIPKSGFYYVTAFVPLGMDFDVAISASVPLYNTSDLQALGCQLNSDTSYCSLSIGKKGIRTHPEKVCLLASSSSSKYNNVVEAAVHFVHYYYNIGSVASFISGVSLIIIILVTVITLIVYCIYRRCKRRHRRDYEQLH